MGLRILGTDIAGLLKKHLAPILLPITLIKEVAGARGTALTAGQQITEKKYPCRGFIDTFKLDQFQGTTVQRGDKKIMIIGDTLPRGVVPEMNDRIIAEGATHVIVSMPERDPDAATYACQSRG